MNEAELKHSLVALLAERESQSAPLSLDTDAVLAAVRSQTPLVIWWRRATEPTGELGSLIAEFDSVLVFKRSLDAETLLGLLRHSALEGLCPDDHPGWQPFPGCSGETHDKD